MTTSPNCNAARATRRKYSRAWRQADRQANRQVAIRHGKVAKRADNWARETANTPVATHDVIVFEDLNLVAMTRSAKGTVEKPGTNVAQKAGSNRSSQGRRTVGRPIGSLVLA